MQINLSWGQRRNGNKFCQNCTKFNIRAVQVLPTFWTTPILKVLIHRRNHCTNQGHIDMKVRMKGHHRTPNHTAYMSGMIFQVWLYIWSTVLLPLIDHKILGNTLFWNRILQTLSSCPKVMEYINKTENSNHSQAPQFFRQIMNLLIQRHQFQKRRLHLWHFLYQ